jgi:hypothetical protein
LGLTIIWIGILFIRKTDNSDDEFIDFFNDEDDNNEDTALEITKNSENLKQDFKALKNKADKDFEQLFEDESLLVDDKDIITAKISREIDLTPYKERTKEESQLMKYILSGKDPEDLVHSSIEKIEANLPFYLQKKNRYN